MTIKTETKTPTVFGKRIGSIRGRKSIRRSMRLPSNWKGCAHD